MKTKRMVHLALLAAAAMVLHVMEAVLPFPSPVPGIKLGLANCVALFSLSLYGVRAALYITVVRVLIGALLSGSFFGPAFLLSAAGGVGSVLIMGFAHKQWRPPFSAAGVSMIGAAAHSMIQVAVAAVLAASASLLWYMPYVVLLAVPAGLATGFTAGYFEAHMSHSLTAKPEKDFVHCCRK